MTEIIDGKKVAGEVLKRIKADVSQLEIKPGLAVVVVGDDPASKVYVKMKETRCKETGIHSERYDLDKDITQSSLIKLIEKLNNDKDIHGILLQIPLPKHIDSDMVLERISPEKDVDGFHPLNMGRVLAERDSVLTCTPKAVMELLDAYKINVKGKDVAIIGKSKLVGKPLGVMLANRDATITLCHIKTKDLKKYTSDADIVIVAAGKAKLLTADMVKDGVVVIDVGINRINGKIVGDVDFENVKKKSSFITPVPGGVGPMTVAMLLENTMELYKNAI
ncbi:MAG: bifunctional methylenetetrahydrofolate dehydrogenase/methenyltetrahydrofolate cyclohydrolase FolD [bacterium]|nr:bifunctional methylenetetrahydrofolate dehydrogenase/methenyltetrahydrofolate cyclohydrolase FolD [bacterium]